MTNKTDNRGEKTVLIVEDQALLRRTMRELSQDAFPDCSFLDVADGAGALHACNAERLEGLCRGFDNCQNKSGEDL